MALDAAADRQLQQMTGCTWDEIAATHDMTCGSCRGGKLELQAVDVVMVFPWNDAFRFEPECVTYWRPDAIISRKTVDVTLRCDRCAIEITMAINARETPANGPFSDNG